MYGEILQAVCRAQIAMGGLMTSDSIATENVSVTLDAISQSWAGTPITDNPGSGPDVPHQEDGQDDKAGLPWDKWPDPPPKGETAGAPAYYTNAQGNAVITFIAYLINETSDDDKIKKLQAESTAWQLNQSSMNTLAEMQKSPWNIMQQAGTTQTSNDESAIGGIAGLGTGIADLCSIPASVVTNM